VESTRKLESHKKNWFDPTMAQGLSLLMSFTKQQKCTPQKNTSYIEASAKKHREDPEIIAQCIAVLSSMRDT
jgi:hypothetical protein